MFGGSRVHSFLLRAFAPGLTRALVSGELPPGRVLDEVWRDPVEYRLAELSYGLRREVTIQAVPRTPSGYPAPVGGTLAFHRENTLYVFSRAVEKGRFTGEFLLFDLPHLIIDRPCCRPGASLSGSLEARLAARLASVYQTLCRVAAHPDPGNGLEGLREIPPDRLLSRIAAWVTKFGPESVRGDLAGRGREIFALARGIIEAAPAAGEQGVGADGDLLPAFLITPSSLVRSGLPARAVEWMAEHYGWINTDQGWDGGFLPLQVLGIGRGICARDRLLYRSGIVAAATSAGKTLLAELRMLARWFAPAAHPKRTLILVPTREIGVERAAALRAAYGTTKRERRLRICFSDGEHHAEDRAIREGQFEVAVLVNEKLKSFGDAPGFLQGVGEVVFDELATMGEEGRGVFLELAMTAALAAHPRMTLLGLTHPCAGLEPVRDAMARDGERGFLLESAGRPISIDVGIWDPVTKAAWFRNCNTGRRYPAALPLDYPENPINTCKQLLVNYVKQTEDERARGQRNNLVVAVPTKRDTQLVARFFASLYRQDAESREILDSNKAVSLLPARLEGMEPTYRHSLLAQLLPCGIGYHDADLSREERCLVSQAFRDGDLPVLICTRTLATGVNLPAQAIVFLGWGRRPGGAGDESAGEPFYMALAQEFLTWLGRVGRYGKGVHRRPAALYLAQAGRGSDEYERMAGLIEAQRAPFTTHLARSSSWTEALLLAAGSLAGEPDRLPSAEEILELLLRTPSASTPEAREHVRTQVLEHLEEITCESEAGPALLERVELGGTEGYRLTPAGSIVRTAGVQFETCRRLTAWLQEVREIPCWSVLDLLALVLATPDGQAIELLRPPRALWNSIRDEFNGRITELWRGTDESWSAHSPLLSAGPREVDEITTLLALDRWRQGLPLSPDGPEAEASRIGIEAAYGLFQPGCNLYEKGRAFSRLLRVLAALAAEASRPTSPEGEPGEPEEPAVRPDGLPGLADGWVAVPWDLEALAEEVLYGLPSDAVPLARLGVEGFCRAWVMALYRQVEELRIAPDLPILERVKQLAENDAACCESLPTHGLRERVREALAAHGRLPLAASLRADPSMIERFYGHPFVVAAQVAQGAGRYTALRVVHRRVYTVVRRNASSYVPIKIRNGGEFTHWREHGAVEFLAEVGSPVGEEYHADRMVVELDPRNDYPLEKLKAAASEVWRRLSAQEWVDSDRVEIRWSGDGGFAIVAPFKGGMLHPLGTVLRLLERLVLRLANDVDLFAREQPTLALPYLILDISAVTRRGVLRNGFSLDATSGSVCLPVEPLRLGGFDPAREATPAAVLTVLERMAGPTSSDPPDYAELLFHFWQAAREQWSSGNALPPLRVRENDAAGSRPVLYKPAAPASHRVAEEAYQPERWPPALVVTQSRLEAVLPRLAESPELALAVQATGSDRRQDQVRLLSVATETGTFVVDCAAVNPQPLLEVLARKRLVGHDLLSGFSFLARQYGFAPPPAEDMGLLVELLDAGSKRVTGSVESLSDLSQRFLGAPVPKERDGSGWSGVLSRERIEYAALHAAVLLPLRAKLSREIEAAVLERAAEIERRCLPAVVWMATTGIPFDAELWKVLADHIEGKAEQLKQELDAVAPPAPGYEAGLDWNWESHESIREALFAAGFKVERTDEQTLAALDVELAQLIIEYRRARKRASTFGRSWLDLLDGGRLYPEWQQIGTMTGRIIGTNPDVQLVPRQDYRAAIAAPPGRVLVSGDYRQVELRIAAHLAGEERMLAAFRAGEDLHARTARELLGKEEVNQEDRRLGKTINLGFLFGMEVDGFRRRARSECGLDMGVEEARCHRAAWFRLYPELARWRERVRRERRGESRTLTGRRRLLQVNAPNTVRLNSPVQGLAADALKRSLALLYERRSRCPGARPVLTSHDEILLECEEAQAEAAAAWLRQAMLDGLAPLIRPTPVEVEMTISRTWGERFRSGGAEAGE
jgi:DNA polymerase I-like protein with 3'-5' exonuclease and polymerase domains